MSAGVDPQRVIQKLALRIAETEIQSAINKTALEDAQQQLAEMRSVDPERSAD